MKTRTQAALFFAAAVGAMSIGVAFTGTAELRGSSAEAMPIPHTHGTAGLTLGACNENGVQEVNLSVASAWDGHNIHKLVILSPQGPLSPTVDAPSYSTHFFVAANTKWVVELSGTFDSGDAILFPNGGELSVTTGSCGTATTVPQPTTTTTCTQAIPPRTDCHPTPRTTTIPTTGPATTVPTVPDVSTTADAPPVSVKKAVAAPPTTGCTVNCGPTGTLPFTGGSDALAGAGIAGAVVALLGLVLVLATRRNAGSES